MEKFIMKKTAKDETEPLSGTKYSGTGWRKATDEEFEREKDLLIERGILHWLHPDEYPPPRYTLDESAFLVSIAEGRGKNEILSKMQICKDEKAVRERLKRVLTEKYGIRSTDDVFDLTSGRISAEAV